MKSSAADISEEDVNKLGQKCEFFHQEINKRKAPAARARLRSVEIGMLAYILYIVCIDVYSAGQIKVYDPHFRRKHGAPMQ